MLTGQELEDGLRRLGVKPEMALEVHCALSSFGPVEGGAETLIRALMQAVGEDGAIVMPSFRLSARLPLDDTDRELGLTCKIRILGEDVPRSGMGIVADTFRQRPDVRTGQGLFRVSAWGKDAERHSRGLQHLIDTGGWALLLGTDIYSLSAMHYVENDLPPEITGIFTPPEEARRLYPEGEWFIEAGLPPVMAWYTIQNSAFEQGFIREGRIGESKCMLFPVEKVVGLYHRALQSDPLALYGLH